LWFSLRLDDPAHLTLQACEHVLNIIAVTVNTLQESCGQWPVLSFSGYSSPDRRQAVNVKRWLHMPTLNLLVLSWPDVENGCPKLIRY